MAEVAEVTDETFEQEVLKSDVPVLVDFWAPGCPPCVALAPVLEKIAAETSDTVKIVKMNAAQEQSTAVKYGIQAVPTLFIFKNGDVADSLIGFQSEQDIRSRLNAAVEGS
jgi:thioredoxin 1